MGTTPDRPEAITPAWLTGVLERSLPGVEVARVEVVDRHSGTTGRARLRLDYASDRTGPATLFVKLPPFDEVQRQFVAVTDMGRREARFYEALAAEAPVRVPRAWYAAHGDAPTDYIMVLEDLEASGCTFARGVDAHAREHGAPVIEALARLHAHFWQDARFESELAWVPRAMRGALGAKLIEQARAKFGADLPAGLRGALPPLRRSPRGDLRSLGRRPLDARPRRHPRGQPVRGSATSSASTTGRSSAARRAFATSGSSSATPARRMCAAPSRTAGSAPTGRAWSTPASTHRTSTPCGGAFAARCSTAGSRRRRRPRWATAGSRSRSVCRRCAARRRRAPISRPWSPSGKLCRRSAWCPTTRRTNGRGRSTTSASASAPRARWEATSASRSTARAGKLDARARIDHLLDPGSFQELGTLVGGAERAGRRDRDRLGARRRPAGDGGGRGLHREGRHDQPGGQLQALSRRRDRGRTTACRSS